MSLKIALLQLNAKPDLEGALEKGLAACQTAKEQGADIALFPEMYSMGYDIFGQPVSSWQAKAIDADCDYTRAFAQKAKELNMAIGCTLLESWHTGNKVDPETGNLISVEGEKADPRNTMILFDRFGRKVLTYSKVHTCDFDVERNLTPGNDFYVRDLDVGGSVGMLKVGCMICYDREYPESARILMLKGAELVLVPNACPMEINRLSQLRARAYENMMAIATCNYATVPTGCNGHSTVFDGVAFCTEGYDLPGGPDGSRDCCLLEAPREEGIYIADIDMDMVRYYRRTDMQGNTFRHPTKYGILVDTKIDEPFIREGYRP